MNYQKKLPNLEVILYASIWQKFDLKKDTKKQLL